MDDLSRKVPLSAAVVVVVVLGGVVAGALVFADDGGGAASAALGQLAPERMELNGRWRGIELAGVTSPAARELGVPPAPDGVAVTHRRSKDAGEPTRLMSTTGALGRRLTLHSSAAFVGT